MRKTLSLIITILLITTQSDAHVRIKDIVSFQGVRGNQLIGYGLVVGLSGTGDSAGGSPYTTESLISMLERLGVNTRGEKMSPKNVAAVMVTAELPPFAKRGNDIDITVSTLGDSVSLLGGTLLITPLMGADGEVYAAAQGAVSVHGFAAKGQSGTSIIKGVPTNGRIASGAIVEKEINFELKTLNSMTLSLRNPDFTTSQRIAETINASFRKKLASAANPSSVMVSLPKNKRELMPFMTKLEQLRIKTDQVARVIIDETTGVIVIGEDVRIDTVAIAQGNLTVRIDEAEQVSQPNPLGQGTTEKVARTDIDIEEETGKKFSILKQGVSLQELVNGLNSLGVGPRDIISILMGIKAAGALQADIEMI